MKPIDFIGIGAQKAGTTWLWRMLKQHPDFDLPYIKEMHYFDRSETYPSPNKLSKSNLTSRLIDSKWLKFSAKTFYYQTKGADVKKLRWLINWYLGRYDDNWYLSLFKSFSGITGEITPSYSILNVNDIKKMHSLIPETKVVFILRNPIERAWSSYRFFLGKKYNVHSLNGTEIKAFFNSPAQELRSNYIRTIENYASVFDPSRILICFFDAISEDPELLFNEILTFLNARTNHPSFAIDVLEKKLVSPKIEMPIEVEKFLVDKYSVIIEQLSNTLGSYCFKWRSTFDSTIDANGHLMKPSIVLDTI